MDDFEILDISSSQEWNEYLQQMPLEQKDIYYTPEYYRLYEEIGDGKAKCFVFRRGGEIAMYPFLINSVNAIGYNLDKEYFDIQGAYGYNGIITSTNDSQFVRAFNQNFDYYCQNENIIAEFTRLNPLLKNHLFSKDFLKLVLDRRTIFLNLNDDIGNIFSNFQTTTRKQIKRATNRYGIEVKRYENDLSILEIFMNIYVDSMVRVKSIPYLFFNKPYFRLLIESTPNICFIAHYNNIPVASILAFYNEYYLNGHLGGTIKEYMHLSPISLLYFEMIKFGKQKGCRYLNVGGGATVRNDDPLLKFKMNFSKDTADFYIGKRIFKPEVYNNVIKLWESRYPEKIELYSNFLLKYRY